jgi:hypothetical protein
MLCAVPERPAVAPEGTVVDGDELRVRRHPRGRLAPAPRARRVLRRRERHRGLEQPGRHGRDHLVGDERVCRFAAASDRHLHAPSDERHRRHAGAEHEVLARQVASERADERARAADQTKRALLLLAAGVALRALARHALEEHVADAVLREGGEAELRDQSAMAGCIRGQYQEGPRSNPSSAGRPASSTLRIRPPRRSRASRSTNSTFAARSSARHEGRRGRRR